MGREGEVVREGGGVEEEEEGEVGQLEVGK